MGKFRLNAPNRLTLSRIALSLVLFVFFFVTLFFPKETFYLIPTTHFTIADLVCFVLFILLASTDSVDGHLARSTHQVTDLGKVLDPIADKFLVDGSLILLSVRSPMLLPPLFVILFVGRDLLVDGFRIMAASKGKVIPANIYGKLKTVFQMILIPVVFLRGFPFNYLDWAFDRADYDAWVSSADSFSHAGETYAMAFSLVLGIITVTMSLVSGAIYLYRGRSVLEEGSRK